ncbi:alpha/beta fold hydrolase [Salinispora vitiensis]|uniref:alpha/beta fold hydrolase n=1 Tax=Salinispora vitiensis TaxID=999544 RepID=UPI001CC597B1|nr:alpha/beta hydrolase [Salinispora vitiensis]
MPAPSDGTSAAVDAPSGADHTNAEVKHELSDSEIAVQCRALDLPVLIIDGIEDIRPRWAVDSLHQALTNSQRMKLARSGHLPWVENPDDFRAAVTTFLTKHSRDAPRGRP